MKKIRIRSASTLIPTIFLVAMGTTRLAAIEIPAGDEVININGQLQVHGLIENVDDPYNDSTRLFLFLRQARLSINGDYKGSTYEVEWMMGGEEVPERNSVMSLLDAYIDTPLTDSLKLKLGQYKVPYGRERLQDSGNSFNVNRSIVNNYVNIGRDVGFTLHQETGMLSGALGLFTGGGINIPERYIPQDIGVPMFIARAGINNGLDEDVFTPVGANSGADNNGFAFYLNGMYNEDSRVGHSTPLNVKYYDKSLMLNSDWNPYVAARGEKAEFYQYGADVAWKGALSETTSLLLTAEAHLSSFSNNQGSLETVGGLASAYVLTEGWAMGVRYAYVDPDSDMAYTQTVEAEEPGGTPTKKLHKITDKAIHEIAPSVVYFIPERNIKLIAEVSYQMDVPVSIEKGNGVYNLMRQSDQVSYVAGEGIDLQDNYTASLIIQYNF
jgi:hypothetical protein